MSEPSVTVEKHSELAIRKGSKSFAAAARLFDRETRESATLLYAWCRYCDDVIDDQVLGSAERGAPSAIASDAGATPEARLEWLRSHTRRALDGEDSTGAPAFDALARVAARHRLSHEPAFGLLDGFAMDVEERTFDELEDTVDYAYHVAGVVGILMAEIMGVREEGPLRCAADLGIAMQLTNISRDVMDDAAAGRVYLPASWLREAGVEPDAASVADPAHRDAVFAVTERLLAEADRYYASGRRGLSALRFRCAWAIATAASVYSEIGREVRRRGSSAWDARVSTSTLRKVMLAARAFGQALVRRSS